MLEVTEMSDAEILEVLPGLHYGHLACSMNNKPYVVPVNFTFNGGEIFIYTTDGKKSGIIDTNPQVCLQTEDITDRQHWYSVIIDGVAERITDPVERERFMKLILADNPTLTPALSIHWMDNWVRENIEIIYRITPTMTSGRRTVSE